MANRRWTSNPDRKITNSAGMTIPKAGPSKSVSPVKNVKIYPMAKGLKGCC